jgi:hypothetical protein
MSTLNFANVITTNPGETIASAFDKVNENFANIAAVGSNVIIGVTTVAGRTGNVYLTVNDVAGAASVGFVNDLIATGITANITSNIASLVTANITADILANISSNIASSISYGGSTVSIPSSGGNVLVIPGGIEVASFSQTKVTVFGDLSVSANATVANIGLNGNTGHPTNTSTIVAWARVSVGGVAYWTPLYQ